MISWNQGPDGCMGRGTGQGNESISLSLHYREFYVDGVNVQQEDLDSSY